MHIKQSWGAQGAQGADQSTPIEVKIIRMILWFHAKRCQKQLNVDDDDDDDDNYDVDDFDDDDDDVVVVDDDGTEIYILYTLYTILRLPTSMSFGCLSAGRCTSFDGKTAWKS